VSEREGAVCEARGRGAVVWKSASGEGAASSLWNQAKLKCQSRFSVFPRCRDAAGPQGAPLSHWWGSYHLHWSVSAFWVRWGGGGSRDLAHAAGFRGSGAAGAPWSKEAPSTGLCCSCPLGTRWGPAFTLGPPFLPSVTSEAFIWLARRIKMLLVLD